MARRSQTDDFRFEGFENPNTTPVPDVVFDQFLSKLGEAELKALLYIIRRTFGFKKDRDPISFNQFLRGITTREGYVLDHGCGIKDRTTLSKALKSLEEKGIVQSEKGVDERGENVTTVYSLHFKNSQSQGVVGNSYHRSMNNPPPVVGSSYPQETVKQQTEINHSNLRKTAPKKKKPDEESSVWQRSRQAGIPPIASSSDPQPASAARGLAAISDVLATRRQKSQCYDKDRQVIVDLLADFRHEFNDQATLKQSVSRAYNLLQRSHLDIGTFVSRMYEARAITKEHSASITSILADSKSISAKHKMAYWFSVLEDLCGLKPTDATQTGRSGGQVSAG